MSSNISQFISTATSMLNATANQFSNNATNSTELATNSTSLTDWASNATAHIGESSYLPTPAVAVGIALVGLAVACGARCLAKAQWQNNSAQDNQPRLQKSSEATTPESTTGSAKMKDVPVIDVKSTPDAPDADSAATQTAENNIPSEPTENSEQQPAQASVRQAESSPVAPPATNSAQTAKRKISVNLEERTAAATALKTQGQKPSAKYAINAPRAAVKKVLEENQMKGIAGRVESDANKEKITAARITERSDKQKKVAAMRKARQDAKKELPTVSKPSRKDIERANAASKKLAAQRAQAENPELAARTDAAYQLKTAGSSASNSTAIKKPRVAVKKMLAEKQQAGIQGREERAARKAQIKAAKEAEQARLREKVAAQRAGKSVSAS